MAPAPPAPLPVADNYASLTNRISLSIASRSSVLKNMNSSITATPVRRRVIPDDNDDDLARGTIPNTGVGYVPERKDIQKYANSKEERFLRGRMGKGTTGKAKKKVEESESEEEMGRSALGKRKRPRKETAEPEPVPEPEAMPENQVLPTATAESEEKNGDAAEVEADVEMKDDVAKEESAIPEKTADKKRRRKNKKKKPKTENAETGAEA
ncbi:hypothetical protein FPSE_09837 [Fusarium pseudograminearum CS3096]|uniref:Uncharacterized protein n=1 Tax=Fusarium pseudograminearum (strain CS3096) TaxID=1028729 RepID=K3V8N4_FUSPC|nr:hypothetical protein FPSE_09837 [Fusarium pseudograminearum CS3096]EKJ69992.1 hypothetical protein FPSE_09837 [Fusarium pseudograminearum CS3096]KAF0644961.1 hypothetical protein FPSE5266_09837 [Fusarium pseudograminearum]